MRMKNRWIGGLAVATALTLGACAPTQQGADESDEPAPAAESVAPAAATAEPSESAEEMESSEASESAEPTPVDYEY
jgi:hypothetical protein